MDAAEVAMSLDDDDDDYDADNDDHDYDDGFEADMLEVYDELREGHTSLPVETLWMWADLQVTYFIIPPKTTH